ncbi:Hoc-like head decoration [Acinetobacter phage Acj9]|uniref:Hoc head outer capsid protein n=1 Tax=Acinetobacter phage Acj9 TaxID=760939 RepID=E5EPX1_9CAUD|nr:Hoc-like head decoration [Acinetobacter phage Acj9]ADG60087.1 Hoc head outer capsid protein [Acinetobacter phage Acj9]
MSVTLPATKQAKVGDTVALEPTITPDVVEGATFQWFKNGEEIVDKTERSITFEPVEQTDSGVYTVSVTVDSEPTVSTPCTLTVTAEPEPEPDPTASDWYIHDLRPARDRGFTWIGWWVLDEIQTALKEDFDWVADPENPRFKHQNVLKALADNKDKWEDIEIQESRNGYILLLSDLTP